MYAKCTRCGSVAEVCDCDVDKANYNTLLDDAVEIRKKLAAAVEALENSISEYVQKTLMDGKLNLEVIWRFDEQQADPFHKNWDPSHFMHALRTQQKRLIAALKAARGE